MSETKINGMRLVVNPVTLEFYLYSTIEAPGLIIGTLDRATTQIKYHVKRGDSSEGRINAFIELKDLPIELTHYTPRPEIQLINQIEVKVNEQQFEVFNPENYEKGLEKNPPKGLNSKRKKKWHRECTAYLQSKKGIEPAKVVKEEIINPPQPAEAPIKENEKVEVPPPAVELPPKVESELNKTAKPKDTTYGQGNKECLLSEYADGCVLANVDDTKQLIIILGTPNHPETGLQRFLVFPHEKQAKFCLNKLKDSEHYKRQLVNGVREFTVTPIAIIPTEKRNVPALAVHDVYKFLNSKIMKIVKNG